MKKIIFVITTLLITGILAGCASKPKSTGVQKRLNNSGDALSHEEYMAQVFEQRLNDFEKKLYSSPLSKKDLYELANMCSYSYTDYEPKPDRRMLQPITTNRKDLSMKITNTTNEDVNFLFVAKNFDNGPYDNSRKIVSEFVIPANETYYVIIEDCITLGEKSITLWDHKSFADNFVFFANQDSICHKSYLFDINNFAIETEIFKTHSIEFVYDKEFTEEDWKKTHDIKYDYAFVEPFEDKIRNEKNLIILHQ